MSDSPLARRTRGRVALVALVAALSLVALTACSGDADVVVPTASTGEVSELTSAQGKALIESDRQVLVIDVRPVAEYRSGHLVGAQSIDASDPEAWRFRTDGLDADRPTVVYCSDAACSAAAAQMLIDSGFAEVYDMGGIEDWDPEVLRLEKPSSSQPLPQTAE